MKATRMLVVGVGNRLMTDEGIGPAVAAELAARTDLPPRTTVCDGGTAGLRLLHLLPGCDRALFIDCVRMGASAGTLRCFSPADVRDATADARLSPHEGNLLHWLSLSRSLGECPPDVEIVGVEPAVVAPGDGLSPLLASRLPDYVAAVFARLSA